MNTFSAALAHLPPALAYTVVALAVLAESVLVLSVFMPTLALLLTAGALARTGHIALVPAIAVAAGAAVAGDFLAHRTGRLLGVRLRAGRLGRRIPGTAWRRAETLMTRHGGRAVFLARFLPMARTLSPHFAGATRTPYRRICAYSATAACLWAAVEAGAGYAAAASLPRLLRLSGPALAAAAVALSTGAVLWLRGRNRRRSTPPSPPSRAG
ncbi:DedA family protein [Streptomyces sp. BBFR2]|uniref:DedA family protein n=1 Tax=Streptomyces sp. BBFR2 TaxID=3372854 RepID=UPI0037D9FA92